MHFVVTNEHIEGAETGRITNCPVARCIKESFPDMITSVGADGKTFIFKKMPRGFVKNHGKMVVNIELRKGMTEKDKDKEKEECIYKYFTLPEFVIERIEHFDETGKMEPFEFDVIIPD
jgi:hypothetical protein